MARRSALHHHPRRPPLALRLPLALCASLALFVPAALAQEGDEFSEVEIKTTKVAGSVYMLEGAGGNIAASVGEDGIVIVDDQFAPLADKIRAALVELGITNKPVRFVINTHYHSDHVGGNASFSRTAAIIAHDNVRERLIAVEPAGNGGSIRFDNEPVEKDALPVITFAQDVTIHVNGDDIRALHFPAGHTDGDAIVFFTKSNVVHTGDDFVRYGFPFIDVASGGSVQGMIEANEKLIEQLPADVKIIPGHGALSSLDDIRAFVRMLRETSAVVEKAIEAGKTVEQMKEEKILESWKQWSGDFINADAFIETLHASLTREPGARFRKHN
jgi:glyoxylase-like metal-dependent hydrolase (beta-lactamase superfamily II)